jgi:hypothetical protein
MAKQSGAEFESQAVHAHTATSASQNSDEPVVSHPPFPQLGAAPPNGDQLQDDSDSPVTVDTEPIDGAIAHMFNEVMYYLSFSCALV